MKEKKDICKFCADDFNTEDMPVGEAHLNLGVIGNFEVTTYVAGWYKDEGDRDNQITSPCLELTISHPTDGSKDLFTQRMYIRYCPMCGQDLVAKFNEED